MGEQYYPARIRRSGLVATGLLMMAPLVASIVFLGLSEPFPAVVLVGLLAVVVIVYVSAFKVRYELDDRELRFRQGLFSAWRIDLRSISRVVPAKGQAGFSLAPSECLLVEAGRQMRLVAAPDTERFLHELSLRAPHLRRYGSELRGPAGHSLAPLTR